MRLQLRERSQYLVPDFRNSLTYSRFDLMRGGKNQDTVRRRVWGTLSRSKRSRALKQEPDDHGARSILQHLCADQRDVIRLALFQDVLSYLVNDASADCRRRVMLTARQSLKEPLVPEISLV